MADGAVLSHAAQSSTGRFFGKYRGLVEDNKDPLKRGRLLVRVPAVMGEQRIWAMPCAPYAGDQVGFFAMPKVGTGVWVEFEAGDPSYPIWVGCFWGDGQIASQDGGPEIKFFKTDKLTIRIDDSSGELVIENAAGSIIKMTTSEISQKSQTIRSEAGAKKTVLNAAQFAVNDGVFKVI